MIVKLEYVLCLQYLLKVTLALPIFWDCCHVAMVTVVYNIYFLLS